MTGGGEKADDLLSRLHARVEWAENDHAVSFAEELLKLRARRLARPRGSVEEALADHDALCFLIGSERYAVPLSRLSEVVPLGAWTPVPGQPQYLLGVTNLRGEIRPVIDLHSLLGLTPPPADSRAWVVFVDHGDSEVGLRVDAFERVASLDPQGLTRPQDSGNGLPQRFVAGIAADTLILLDVSQILALDVLNDARADARRAS
ncbi:chemotaxis protein [Paramagnetospirillum marisnigri]|uniref:Chemotaxis protein n=1 Tax=Paramagnetospirillum marisnigri TaxID=1285242 RepID=A0A178MWL5_9PROT|nr:chemotaxis protein CheW [Paramagnetospirillum marisnigri]OAN53712.1 chemotaxis protein [Paramagnetospirillum marisnigri]